MLTLWGGRAEARPSQGRIDAELSISADLATLRGTATVQVENRTGSPMEEISLWLFPERLAHPPADLDDVILPRAFPAGFDAGGIRVDGVTDAQGRALELNHIRPGLSRVRIGRALLTGERYALIVKYEITVPARYGPFGRVDEQLTLDGGFLPRPPPQSAVGFHEQAPPGRVDWSLSIKWEGEGELEVFVNGQRGTLSSEPWISRGEGAERVSLVAAPRFEHATIGPADSPVRFAHRRARPEPGSGGGIPDLAAIDPIGQELATASAVLDYLALRERRPRRALVMVEAPLRRDIAVAAPGMVLVSDRALELMPTERFLRVHRVALARAVVAERLDRVAVREPTSRASRVRDMVSIHLSEAWEAAVYGGRAGIREILGPGRFIAAVEDVIRAPQIPFQSAWFRVVDDTDVFRDRFSLFSHRHPNGRIWREKLVDELGWSSFERLVDAMVLHDAKFLTSLAQAAPDIDGLSFLAQWDQGPPEVNYRLESVRPVDGGLEVTVVREGAVALREPVQIVALGARRITAEWRGEGKEKTVLLAGAGAGDQVVIDPGFRLVESDLGGALHPRFDNRRYHPWRALVRGFGFDINSVTGRVNTTVAGSLLRTDDFRHAVSLRIFDRERSASMHVNWLRAFGPKIRSTRRRYGWGTGLAVSWLKPVSDSPEGVGVTLSGAVADSTTVSSTDPRSGHVLSLAAGPVFAAHEGRSTAGAFAKVGGRGVLSLGRRHVIAGRLEAGLHWGDVLDTQQWAAGGVQGVRAIGPYASPGRHRLFGSLEWRHRLAHNLSWSLLNLSWVEAIDGVFFGDLASVTDDMDDLVSSVGLYGGAGYGLRLHHRVGGFQPMVLSIDYGVPLLADGRSTWPPAWDGSLVVAVGQIF